MRQLKDLILSYFLNYELPSGPTELSPEDKFNLSLLYEDDMYRSYKKLAANYEYLIHAHALSHNTPLEAENYRGQLLALKRMENTLKKLNRQEKRKNPGKNK